jgi:hypothetical protein
MSSKHQEKKTQQHGPSYIDDEVKEEEKTPAVQQSNGGSVGGRRASSASSNPVDDDLRDVGAPSKVNSKKKSRKNGPDENLSKPSGLTTSLQLARSFMGVSSPRRDNDSLLAKYRLSTAPGADSSQLVNTTDPTGDRLSTAPEVDSSPLVNTTAPKGDPVDSQSDTFVEADGDEESVLLPGALRVSGNNGVDNDDDELSRTNVPSSNDNVVTTLEAVLVMEEGTATEEDRQRLKEEIRDEFLQSAVTGEVSKVSGDDDPRTFLHNNRKMFLIIGGISVIIAIASVVFGIVFGTRRTTQENTNMLNTTPNRTVSSRPSTLPTLQPTSTPQPSPMPSAMPSVQPSAAPSVPIANLDNGNYEEAHPLVLRNAPLEASLSNAAIQVIVTSCGGSFAECKAVLWYTYRARSSGPVSVITCGAASVSVFERCFLTPYTNGDIGNCGGSSISWEAEIGEQYYVLVSPSSENSAQEDFTIQIVDNDKCDHAFGPITPPSFGAVVSYTTTNAEVDSDVRSCGGASATTSPGVWYQVKGNGRALTASTCLTETTFDTQISVFRGGCGSLACLNGNNDFCELQSTVVWPSQEGEIYHILVHGSNGSTGQFELKISTDIGRTINDFCESAEVVIAGDRVPFAFSGASADPDLPLCDSNPNGLPDDGTAEFPYGLWYKIVGTGFPISTTVDSDSISPVTMIVYYGSCGGGLSCGVIDSRSEDTCLGDITTLECTETSCFASNEGEVYYVFVSTVSLEAGDVEHSLTIGSCVLSSGIFIPPSNGIFIPP